MLRAFCWQDALIPNGPLAAERLIMGDFNYDTRTMGLGWRTAAVVFGLIVDVS